MIQDNDKLHGVVEIAISLTDTRGKHTLSTAIVARGFTLADVGTVVQRETYELLRAVAEGQTEKDKALDDRAKLAQIIGEQLQKQI